MMIQKNDGSPAQNYTNKLHLRPRFNISSCGTDNDSNDTSHPDTSDRRGSGDPAMGTRSPLARGWLVWIWSFPRKRRS